MKLLHTITALALLAGLALAADAPKPEQPTQAQQEYTAMTQICELAKYASRVQADQPCAYFVEKYRLAVEAEKKAKK